VDGGEKGGADIFRAVRGGVDIAAGFRGERETGVLKPGFLRGGWESEEGGTDETGAGTEGGGKVVGIALVGEIAAPAARDEELAARGAGALQNEGATETTCSKESSGAGADDKRGRRHAAIVAEEVGEEKGTG
jgi:hypothetical protein